MMVCGSLFLKASKAFQATRQVSTQSVPGSFEHLRECVVLVNPTIEKIVAKSVEYYHPSKPAAEMLYKTTNDQS